MTVIADAGVTSIARATASASDVHRCLAQGGSWRGALIGSVDGIESPRRNVGVRHAVREFRSGTDRTQRASLPALAPRGVGRRGGAAAPDELERQQLLQLGGA